MIFNFHEAPSSPRGSSDKCPPHRGKEMGVFSICWPVRHNPIGMSVLEVLGVEGTVIHVKDWTCWKVLLYSTSSPTQKTKAIVPVAHKIWRF